MSRSHRSLIAVTLLALGACASSGSGVLPMDGSYRHEEVAVRVTPSAGHSLDDLLGVGWALSNFDRDALGRLDRPRRSGPRWSDKVSVDANDDGVIDITTTVPKYDLLYESRTEDASIWLTVVAVSEQTGQKALPTLAQRYVNGIAGGIYGWNAHAGVMQESRWAAAIVSEAMTTIGSRPAYRFDVDVANLDQLRLTPDARERRLRVVIVRPGDRAYHVGRELVPGGLPVIVTLVMSSTPEAFERNLAALDRLASHVAFGALPGESARMW